jgi:hypothetical protein
MENDITLEVLDAVANTDDTADNSVKKIKDGVKRYSERLNADREKIKNQLETDYKSKLSTLLGVEIKNLTQDEIDAAVKAKIDDSDVVKEANKIIEANNAKLVQENLDNNIAKIKAINPSIDTVEKLCAHPQYNDIKAKVDKGYELYDAYISVVGFENTSSNSQSSIVKPNINSKTIPYVQPETMTEATLEFYKKAFPNKTKEEILAMYRRDSK